MTFPKIWFYLPEEDGVNFPANIDDYWQWQISSSELEEVWGRYHWVLQTYLFFCKFGIDCELTRELPPEGIVISHRDCIPNDIQVIQSRYIICLLVDRLNPHPYANFHILHNPSQELRLFGNYSYMPPWPQIGLISRDNGRGTLFKNIMYFGYPKNLIKDLSLDSFHDELYKIRLKLQIITPSKWNDFSKCDAILGVRMFGRSHLFGNKPSLKLYNAWLARVPAILGYECAYRIEGCAGEDYLEATSREEVLKHLNALKNDISLRQRLVTNGWNKVQQFLPEATIKRWQRLLQYRIIPDYQTYIRRPYKKSLMKVVGRVREGLVWRYPLVTNTYRVGSVRISS